VTEGRSNLRRFLFLQIIKTQLKRRNQEGKKSSSTLQKRGGTITNRRRLSSKENLNVSIFPSCSYGIDKKHKRSNDKSPIKKKKRKTPSLTHLYK